MRISDWSSDVCSSDLWPRAGLCDGTEAREPRSRRVDRDRRRRWAVDRRQSYDAPDPPQSRLPDHAVQQRDLRPDQGAIFADQPCRQQQPVDPLRSEEHTSELQSLMRISYDVFCLKKKKNKKKH